MSCRTATCCTSSSTYNGLDWRAMLLRLFLAALVACLSLPAMAQPVCHAPEVTAAEQHGHHAAAPDREERAAPAHMCIGCVPPAARLSAVGEPLPPVALPAPALAVDMTEGRAVRPAVPPPRSFA
jgi:hypothetical protein